MNRNDALPLPLRGPVGFRELSCSSRYEPLLAKIPVKRFDRFAPLLLLPILSYVYWEFFRLPNITWVESKLAFSIFPLFVASEVALGFSGAVVVARSVSRWRSAQRLPELSLTNLRPLVIAQSILANIFPVCVRSLGVAYGLFALFLLIEYPTLGLYLAPYGALAVNALLSFYAGAWMQLALSLGTREPVKAYMQFASSAVVLGFPTVLLFFLALFYCVTLGTVYNLPAQLTSVYLGVALPLFLADWAIKLTLMRAYAASIERTIFPRMEF